MGKTPLTRYVAQALLCSQSLFLEFLRKFAHEFDKVYGIEKLARITQSIQNLAVWASNTWKIYMNDDFLAKVGLWLLDLIKCVQKYYILIMTRLELI